jgi:putative two-component system response regulator
MDGERPILLLAEDDEAERQHLAELADELGFGVIQAADGHRALAVARRRLPDVLVTDLYMPLADGLSLVEKLRALPGGDRVPVLMITSDDLRRTKIRALQAGVDDFLVKPVDHLEFAARLGALARRARLVGRLGAALAAQQTARVRLEQDLARPSATVVALAAAMERGPEPALTRAHLQRVAEISGLLARAFGQDRATAEQIRHLAILHDVGMVAVGEAALRGTGELPPAAREELRTHTLLGAEILREAGLPGMACDIAAHHHERWDGGGYPHGLAGTAIPLAARIVAVADCFDALVATSQAEGAGGLDLAWAGLDAAVTEGRLDPDLAGSLRAVSRHVERLLRAWPPKQAQRRGWEP